MGGTAQWKLAVSRLGALLLRLGRESRARRRSSCQPVASRTGAAVGQAQGAVLLEEAKGSWVAVLLLPRLIHFFWLLIQ